MYDWKGGRSSGLCKVRPATRFERRCRAKFIGFALEVDPGNLLSESEQ